MKTKAQGGRKVVLILLIVAGLEAVASAQWQIGQPVPPPFPSGNYYSMSRPGWPPWPFLPCTNAPVYYLGTLPGTTNNAFAYDDRTLTPDGQSTESGPPLPGGGTTGSGGGGETNTPMGGPLNIGTNLYLFISSLANQQAGLVLTNTHNGTYYQLESRPQVNGAPWALGQIVQDTGMTHEVGFSNVPTYYPAQMFFRAAGGNSIASIGLDPDWNLAVAPSTLGGTWQPGYFRVSLSPAPSSAVTVVYEVCGSASNGVHYTTLSGTVTVPSSGMVTIPVAPLYAAGALPDATVILTLALGNGYLVNPGSASATMKIYRPRPAGMAVAIHDSGWTKMNGLSSTNWNYFVMPESVKEALRSDGTPFVVVGDGDIANGVLTNGNGSPKYPILISLAAEAIRDEEIAALTNYVAAGGFVLAGSSSFTRNTDGSFRGNFALTSQMGLSCSPSTNNWAYNTDLYKAADQVLVNDVPTNGVVWRMPTNADEISWGTCLTHAILCNGTGYNGPHQIWQTQVPTNSGVQVLAWGDTYPYLTVNPYGSGQFIYNAALQPLLGHGGFAPGMYAYMIFKRAIEWAFASAQLPVVRLSPWPYQYNAAFMVRHDLENYVDEVADVESSAYIEYTNGAKGDYYFCTGAITNAPGYSFDSVVADLQQAIAYYGVAISCHNGGLENPRGTSDTNSCCDMNDGSSTYEYFHWGPDEALDLPGGYYDASNSVATSFAQIEAWLTNQTNSPRLWVAPYFNATREGSYQIEEQVNVQITGDQKLTPFPAFTLSTQTDGKRYALLSEPVSDWFVDGAVAQSLDPWHPPGVHTLETMQAGVDFYYTNGFLINFYSHGLSTGNRPYPQTAGYLIPAYVQYGMNALLHPNLWPANARDVYQWWLNRSTALVTASYATTNGTHSLATITINGAQDTNTAVEVLAQGFGSVAVSLLRTNGVVTSNNYRIVGETLKVLVGASVTNVQVEYFPGPLARNDFYTATEGQALSVSAAAGVLSNDWSGSWPGLSAVLNGGPSYGTLTLNSDGSFNYTPTNGFWGTDCFTYEATDGVNNFGTATVTVSVTMANTLFSDDFTRCVASSLAPWQVYEGQGVDGQWALGSGVMQGNSQLGNYAFCYFNTNRGNYSVEATMQFPAGAFGGGIGGRLNPTTGAHYAAWIYPEGSLGAAGVLAIIKFSTWTDWGNDSAATNSLPLAQATLASVGTTNHTVKLTLNGNNIAVYYDDLATPAISTSDTAYSIGGVSLDMWTDVESYLMSVRDLSVTNAP